MQNYGKFDIFYSHSIYRIVSQQYSWANYNRVVTPEKIVFKKDRIF